MTSVPFSLIIPWQVNKKILFLYISEMHMHKPGWGTYDDFDPLGGNRQGIRKWAHQDSNLGPTGYEPVALPTELWALS
jgi:hypothetical protein